MTETMDNPKTAAQTRWDKSVPEEPVPSEPEGIRMATGGIQAQEWELPVGLILEKDSQYGVDLWVDYVNVKIGPQGQTVSIEWGLAKLFDYRQSTDNEEQAVEYEIDALLESEVVPQEEKDDEGKMVKLTDEEREDRARDLANQSELEYGNEELGWLAREIGDDDGIPGIFKKELYTFWYDEGWSSPTRQDRPEDSVSWLSPDEEQFLDTVQDVDKKIFIEDDPSIILRGYALAVTEIMERLDRQDFMATFRKVIPIWSYMRLKYELKGKENTKKMSAHDLRERKDRLDQMRYWLKMHKTEMLEAARNMLDTKGLKSETLKSKKGAKQLTVEMKKAKMKPRTNPETYTERLLDYYNALGQDPEIPIDWLIAEGATPDQIFAAADELLKTGRIDPPDYWAITATLSGVDYHVVVPRGNPTANEELAQSKKLQKAAREKHGSLPDKVDKLFRQLKVRFKGKSDSELLDMAKEQLGVKKRQNPSFKNAREALKDALKRLTTIEVVEYQPYEPPEPEPTTEESVESLERTAKVLIEEEEEIEEGVKALESLTAQTVKDDWTAMFDRERKEHPTLPEEVVKRIVDDHMAFKKGLTTLAPKDEIEGRENPRVEDVAAKAFWERKAKLGPKAIPMGEQMPRRKGEPPQKAEERRDEVRVYGEPGLADDPEVVAYYLWGNLIARLAINEQDHKTLSISSAGFETKLTHGRLISILSEGEKQYPILGKFRISKDRGFIWLERRKKLKHPDPKTPWHTHEYEKVCAVSSTMYPLDEVKGKLPRYTTSIDLEATLKENIDSLTGKPLKQQITEIEIPIDTLEEVQNAIDAVEKGIAEYRAANKDFDSTPVEVAEKLGTRQKFEELLKHRDELMWRGNPDDEPINFVLIKRLPRGVKKVAEISENWHTFYRTQPLPGRLFLENCAGDILEVFGSEGCSYKEISDDFENLPDEWGERIHGNPAKTTDPYFVRVEGGHRKILRTREEVIEYAKTHRIVAVSRKGKYLKPFWPLIEENPKIPYTPPDAPDVEVKCPVTGKYTWSCTRCALFDGRSEQFIECKAKEGKKYYLAKARDKRGTVWDTYVLPRNQRKAGIETRAMGGD
jgi:hypothetical protein